MKYLVTTQHPHTQNSSEQNSIDIQPHPEKMSDVGFASFLAQILALQRRHADHGPRLPKDHHGLERSAGFTAGGFCRQSQR